MNRFSQLLIFFKGIWALLIGRKEMPENNPTEEIANLDLVQRMLEQERSPFRDDFVRLKRNIDDLFEIVNQIGQRWKNDYLEQANPNNPDLDEYAKPIIVFAEIIRKYKPLISLVQLIYEKSIELTENHCEKNNIDLHRGALYANLAITFLEQMRYKKALPWLHAAAKQDIDHRDDASTNDDSYAFSKSGIFRQWLDSHVIPLMPTGVLSFVNNHLGSSYTNKDVKEFIDWLSGRGDLHLISSLLDYNEVSNRNDYHAYSVRLSSIRDLATLFEVVFKQIGVKHNDTNVQANFIEPPTLAGLICHMHFQKKLKQRRRNPAHNSDRQEGLFHNSLLPNDDLLDAIDSEIDYCAGQAHNVGDVWTHLNSITLSTNNMVNETGKRILLAYKLRNTTSHSFNPTDPDMVTHYDDFRLWLLQSVFFIYFWVKHEGYASV